MYMKIFFAILSLIFNTQSDPSIESYRLNFNSQILDRTKMKSDIKSLEEYAKQQYRIIRSRGMSSTFMQSRRFHSDQFARDNRELNQPFGFNTQAFSSYYYSYGGPGANLAISSQEACRLTGNFCARDYQCCSGKCRCVRWSNTGQMSCWKKCF